MTIYVSFVIYNGIKINVDVLCVYNTAQCH